MGARWSAVTLRARNLPSKRADAPAARADNHRLDHHVRVSCVGCLGHDGGHLRASNNTHTFRCCCKKGSVRNVSDYTMVLIGTCGRGWELRSVVVSGSGAYTALSSKQLALSPTLQANPRNLPTVIVACWLAVPAFPSVTVKSKVSCPLKLAAGVYVKAPAAPFSVTVPPCVVGLVTLKTVMVSPSASVAPTRRPLSASTVSGVLSVVL